MVAQALQTILMLNTGTRRCTVLHSRFNRHRAVTTPRRRPEAASTISRGREWVTIKTRIRDYDVKGKAVDS